MPSLVFTAESSEYQTSLSSYWTQQEQFIHPSCIVLPSSADDVSRAVEILSYYNTDNSDYARTGFDSSEYDRSHGGCPFAIKSGGHAPFPGKANIERGVTIDLSQLNSIEIHEDQKTASVGSGNRWGRVYSTLESAGYTVPGGRDTSIGVGGLTLGGGISFFSPRVGFVCDAVTNFEIVLESGEIVNANTSSNPQLFRSLKGGSNNFGVVTKMDLPLLEPDMWGGFLITDISARTTAFDFIEEFGKSDRYDENAALIDTNAFVNGSWLLVLHMAYTRPNITAPSYFDPLLSLPGERTMRQGTHFNLTHEFELGQSVNMRAMWKTMTMKNNAAFMETVFQLGNSTVRKFADAEGLQFMVNFQPLPQTIIKHAETNGGNALGLDDEDGDLVIMHVLVNWMNEKDDENIYLEVWNMIEKVKAQAKSNGLWNEFEYLNYGMTFKNLTQKVIESYGTESLEMMRAVSTEYDPTGLFQRAVRGGFKL